MARPNKRIRQARAKARSRRMNEAATRHANAEAIPNVRSNVSSWSRVPKFGGVGYTSGGDSASFGQRDMNVIASKRLDYADPSLLAYGKLSPELKKIVDKKRESVVS